MAGKAHNELLATYMAYLEERGCQAIKIPEGATKTPDLEVLSQGTRYLNEFKSPELQLNPMILPMESRGW